ncbi:cysteine hydrolase [Brevundimonas sp. Root1279]|uniref:cysteine hydrolase n=1 Tax=Brevundimonas sp. Root1279 TaxID=1736443 RepID=UPI0006FD12AD|nr:cysteine hydrolase [Brevundimonas sp. Root1279]KQW80742.1 cysteine hydrolase [Brevundimonas sp. Root1279]
MSSGIRFGPIPANAVHLCIDMQRLFAEETPWRTPWMTRVLPVVVKLCEHRPERVCFTRFIPARQVGEGRGAWRRYWTHWSAITLENLDESLIDLLPELRLFTPPARVLDKTLLSPWVGTGLADALAAAGVDTVIISGAETDVCVLAAVLGAVDLGFRVIVVTDALCSSSDDSHDALIGLYHDRYGQQIETAECDEVVEAWRD